MFMLSDPASKIEGLYNTIKEEIKTQSIYLAGGFQIDFSFNGKDVIYLLDSGKISTMRISDGKIVASYCSQTLLGVDLLFSEYKHHRLIAETNCLLYSASKIEVAYFFESNNLWKDAFLLTTNLLNDLYKRDEIMSSSNTYSLVRNHLNLLWSLPVQERDNISLFKFISQRTDVSRSSLNKIVRELEIGGYISTHRGILKSMKELPKKY